MVVVVPLGNISPFVCVAASQELLMADAECVSLGLLQLVCSLLVADGEDTSARGINDAVASDSQNVPHKELDRNEQRDKGRCRC